MSKGKGKHTINNGVIRRSERICLLVEKKRIERENRKRLRQHQQQQQSSTFKQSLHKQRTRRARKTRRLAVLGGSLNARQGENQEFIRIDNGVRNKECVIDIERRYTYTRKYEVEGIPIYDFQEPLKLVDDGLGYRESLMRFVRDLGPIAQTVANQKLGLLSNYDQQLSEQVQYRAQMPPASVRVPPLPDFNKNIRHQLQSSSPTFTARSVAVLPTIDL